jgi:hypothetical protein
MMTLVLILGGGFGFLVQRAHRQRDAVAAIRKAGGDVTYDWEWKDGQYYPVRNPGWLARTAERLGPDYFGSVRRVALIGGQGDRADDALLAVIGRLDRLEELNLNGSRRVTDAGLTHLRGLRFLRRLELSLTGVQGPGLVNLKGLSRLEELQLNAVPVSDDDLAQLSGLTSLVKIELDGRRVTDAGLAHLKGLTNLSWFQLHGGPVTRAGLTHLRGMRNLKLLSLPITRVESLEPVRHLTGIEHLNLIQTMLDDAGLAAAGGFTGLQLLYVQGTRVTDEGLSRVHEMRGSGSPRLQVIR